MGAMQLSLALHASSRAGRGSGSRLPERPGVSALAKPRVARAQAHQPVAHARGLALARLFLRRSLAAGPHLVLHQPVPQPCSPPTHPRSPPPPQSPTAATTHATPPSFGRTGRTPAP